MPPKQTSTPSFGCLLILFTTLAIVGLVCVIGIVGIPTQVSDIYGPPSPRLSNSQRMLLIFQLWQQRQALTTPFNPAGSEQRFRVETGESVPEVAGRLQQQGLIASAEAFRAYLVYRGLDISLQAGEYQLTAAMTIVEIAHALQDATPATVTFGVLAGWRAEEIAAALPTSGLNISPEAFLHLVQQAPQGYPFSANLPESSSAPRFCQPRIEFTRGGYSGLHHPARGHPARRTAQHCICFLQPPGGRYESRHRSNGAVCVGLQRGPKYLVDKPAFIDRFGNQFTL
jgi:hypothetical protein